MNGCLRPFSAMDVVRFGLGMRALRRRRGWTQDEVGRKARVSRSVVWRLERGQAYISYERYLAGDRVKLNHRAYEVIGVPHNAARMFRSACGPEILLGVHGAKNMDGAQCIERR